MSKKPVEDEPKTANETNYYFKVEDLINLAFGQSHKNVIHSKLIQTVLLILARHMRILEQKVEFRDKDGAGTEVFFENTTPGKVKKYKLPDLPTQLTTKAGEIIRELYEKTLLPDIAVLEPGVSERQISESRSIRDTPKTVEPAVIESKRLGKRRTKSADEGKRSSWEQTDSITQFHRIRDVDGKPKKKRIDTEYTVDEKAIRTDQSEPSVLDENELGEEEHKRPENYTMEPIDEESDKDRNESTDYKTSSGKKSDTDSKKSTGKSDDDRYRKEKIKDQKSDAENYDADTLKSDKDRNESTDYKTSSGKKSDTDSKKSTGKSDDDRYRKEKLKDQKWEAENYDADTSEKRVPQKSSYLSDRAQSAPSNKSITSEKSTRASAPRPLSERFHDAQTRSKPEHDRRWRPNVGPDQPEEEKTKVVPEKEKKKEYRKERLLSAPKDIIIEKEVKLEPKFKLALEKDEAQSAPKDLLKLVEEHVFKNKPKPVTGVLDSTQWVEQRERDKILIEGPKFHIHIRPEQLKQLQYELIRRGLRLNAQNFGKIMKLIQKKGRAKKPKLRARRTRTQEILGGGSKHGKEKKDKYDDPEQGSRRKRQDESSSSSDQDKKRDKKGKSKRDRGAESDDEIARGQKAKEKQQKDDGKRRQTQSAKDKRKKPRSSSSESDWSDEHEKEKKPRKYDEGGRKRSSDDESDDKSRDHGKKRGKSADYGRRRDSDLSDSDRKGRSRSLDDYGKSRRDSVEESEKSKPGKGRKRQDDGYGRKRGESEDSSDKYPRKGIKGDYDKDGKDKRSRSESPEKRPIDDKYKRRSSSEDILGGVKRGRRGEESDEERRKGGRGGRQSSDDEYGEGGRRGKGKGEKDGRSRGGEDDDEYDEGGRRGKGKGEKDGRSRGGEDDEGGRGGKGKGEQDGRSRGGEDDDEYGEEGRRGKGKGGKGGVDDDESGEGERRGKGKRGRDGKGGRGGEDDEYGGGRGGTGRGGEDDDGGRGGKGKGDRDRRGDRRGDDDDEYGKGRDGQGGRDGEDDDEYGKGARKGKGRGDRDGRGGRGGEDDDEEGGRGRKGRGGKGGEDDDESVGGLKGKSKKGRDGKGGEDDEEGGRGGKGKDGEDDEYGDKGRGGKGKGGRDRRGGRDGDDDDKYDEGGRGGKEKGGDDEGGRKGKGKRDKDGRGRRYSDEGEEDAGGKGGWGVGGENDQFVPGKKGKGGRGKGGEDDEYGHGGKGGDSAGEDDEDGGRRGKGKGDRDGKGRQGDEDDDGKGGRGGKGRGGKDDDERGRDKDRGKRGSEDKDKRGKGKRASDAGKGKRTSDTDGRGKGPSRKSSLTVEEEKQGKDKIIVVKKRPSRTDTRGPPRVGSIQCVTQEEFQELEERVRLLSEKAGPLPVPKLPDNKKLRTDIARGSATLTDTMKAMQLAARVDAAEKAVDRLAEMMTQLAAQGSLPAELAEAANIIKKQLAGLLPKDIDALSGIGKKPFQVYGQDDTKGKFDEDKQFGDDQVSRYAPTSALTGTGRGAAVSLPAPPFGAKFPGTGAGKWAGMTCDTGSEPVTSGISSFSKAGAAAGAKRLSGSKRPSKGTLKFAAPSNFDEALQAIKDEMLINLEYHIGQTNNTAQNAILLAHALSDKLTLATEMDDRISTLDTIIREYAQALSGFDQGFASQMISFDQQIDQIRKDMNDGLRLMESALNQSESDAVLELTSKYEALVFELEGTVHDHLQLAGIHDKLNLDLKSLINTVENMREEKADRDEVLDALKDKADVTRLEGLLKDERFNSACRDIEGKIMICHDKFDEQDRAWMNALDDMRDSLKDKAQLIHLQALRDEEQEELQNLLEKLQCLTKILGEPKAAILTRKISLDGRCAVCRIPAQMDAEATVHAKLPPLRPPPAGAEDDEPSICLLEIPKADIKVHGCHRWAGGSHTIINEHITHEQATVDPGPPAKKYLAEGTDGKVYKMEVPVLPCEECNPEPKIPGETEPTPKTGAGGDQVNVINVADARKVTIIDEDNIRSAQTFEAKSKDPARRASIEQPLKQYITQRVSLGARSSVDKRKSLALEQNLTTLAPGAVKFFAGAIHPEERRLSDIGSVVKGQSMRISQEDAISVALRQEKRTEAERLQREFTSEEFE